MHVDHTKSSERSLVLPKILDLLADELLVKLAAREEEAKSRYQAEYPQLQVAYEQANARFAGATIRRSLGLVRKPEEPVKPENFRPYLHLYRDVAPIYEREYRELMFSVLDRLESQGLLQQLDFGSIHIGPDYYVLLTAEGREQAQRLRKSENQALAAGSR